MRVRLLETKFYRPAPLPRQVQRTHLIHRLNEGLLAGCRLTLVSAPAGFGKSTCVSEWLDTLEEPAAWLSLDAADNDPGRFFAYFVAALQKANAAIGREVEDILDDGSLPWYETVITSLIHDILNTPGKLILILDDFQVIRESLILKGLEMLVANQPRNLHLVLISREDPPLPLSRLRAHHQLAEIRVQDLRFTRAEAVHFLNDMTGLGLEEQDIAVLEERTEGWAAGLQLAAIALRSFLQPSSSREQGSVSGFIAHLSGSHRYILSYLTEEVLHQQPEAIQTFLLQTSILDKLCGELCDAVTAQTGSQALLEQLQRTNLFLIPLDDDQRWFRYHHLFADLLQDRQFALRKNETAELHRRASAWYLREGLLNEAIQHALAGKDYAQAVSLIENRTIDLLTQGYIITVEEWLNAIPAEFRAKSPRTNLAFAWSYLLRGAYPQAAAYVEGLQKVFSSAPLDPQEPALQAEWFALQSYLLTTQGKAAESLELAQRALQIAPGQEGYARSLAFNALGCAYLLLDDYPQSVQAYQAAIQEGRASGNIISEMMGISILAQMAIQHGQLHFAGALASQGIERGKRGSQQSGAPLSILAIEHATLGQVSYHWNQLDQARSHFQRAIQLCSLGGYNYLEMFYRVCFARLLQMEGNLAAAAQEVQSAVEQMQSGAHAWAREEVIAQQVSICLAQNHITQAENTLALMTSTGQEGAKNLADTFTLPTLAPDQHLDYPVGRLFNSALRILIQRAFARKAFESLSPGIELATALIDRATQLHYLPVAIETLLLRAQLHVLLQDQQAGLSDVIQAVELAEPEGFITIFIEEGPPVIEMLNQALHQGKPGSASPAYIQNILAAYARLQGKAAPPTEGNSTPEATAEPEMLMEPLSAREQEVLQLIGEGCSNQEIAARLVLSLHTVKKHVSNLIIKLGVNSRTQAVAQAHKLRLL